MKIYLDVCCLNRPFDDQAQSRVRAETLAIVEILRQIEIGALTNVSSEAVVLEVDAIPNEQRRREVRALLPSTESIRLVEPTNVQRAAELINLGFKPGDALHVAVAEASATDLLLSCDDQFCRVAKRHAHNLHVRVCNPLEWLNEVTDGQDT